jgi:7-keto-8-aminopelargonate synthetase-like enzyme
MDGDVAPLEEIVAQCRARDAVLVVDESHGVGALGPRGGGVLAARSLTADVITASTAKGLAVPGGFVAGSRAMMDYLRFASRPQVFSTATAPGTVAGVAAALDVIESDNSLLERLSANVRYAREKLSPFGASLGVESPIVILPIPAEMNVARAGDTLYRHRVYVTYAAFPAVPRDQQRFRICITASHTTADIDALASAFDAVWSTCVAPQH